MDADSSKPSIHADAAELRQFVLALGSGDYFRSHSKSFNPNHRVDRELLRNLQATREQMTQGSSRHLDPRMIDALLCRVVFTCYLFDRKIIGDAYLQSAGLGRGESLRDLLGRPKHQAKELLYSLFTKLGEILTETSSVMIYRTSFDTSPRTTSRPLSDSFAVRMSIPGQGSFWPYDFGVIPIETISAIYEHFLESGRS